MGRTDNFLPGKANAALVADACSAAAVDSVTDVGVEDGDVGVEDGEVGASDGRDEERGVGVGTAEPAFEGSMELEGGDVDVDEFVPEGLAAKRVQVLTACTASFP